jgi:hypothetical protein
MVFDRCKDTKTGKDQGRYFGGVEKKRIITFIRKERIFELYIFAFSGSSSILENRNVGKLTKIGPVV